MNKPFTLWLACGFVVLGWDSAAPQLAPAAPPQTTPGRTLSGADRIITLKAMPAAPIDARGAAEWSGNGLVLHLQGLSPGLYRLYAERKSNGSAQLLGNIPIADPSATPDQEANNNKHESSTTHQAEALETKVNITWSGSLDRKQIARLVLTDRAGNKLMVGNVS